MRVLRLQDSTSGCRMGLGATSVRLPLPQKSHPRKEAPAALHCRGKLLSGGPETSTWRDVTAVREDGAAAPPPRWRPPRPRGCHPCPRSAGLRRHRRARQAGGGVRGQGGDACAPLSPRAAVHPRPGLDGLETEGARASTAVPRAPAFHPRRQPSPRPPLPLFRAQTRRPPRPSSLFVHLKAPRRQGPDLSC